MSFNNQRQKATKPNFSQFDTPATKLLEKRRMMYEVHENFEMKKTEFKKEEVKFKEDEKQIREDDLAIQQKLIMYWKVLADNEKKRKRANEKKQAEKLKCDARENEIIQLQENLNYLTSNKERKQKKVNNLKKYEEYLRRVIQTKFDSYQDVKELKQRYHNLEKQNHDLDILFKKTEKENKLLQNNLIHFVKDKQNDILKLSNEIANLKKQHEEINNQKNDLVSQVELSAETGLTNKRNQGRVYWLIINLKKRCLDWENELKKFKKKRGKMHLKGIKQDDEEKEEKREKKEKKKGKQKKEEEGKDMDTLQMEKQVEDLEYIGDKLYENQAILQELNAPKNKQQRAH